MVKRMRSRLHFLEELLEDHYIGQSSLDLMQTNFQHDLLPILSLPNLH